MVCFRCLKSWVSTVTQESKQCKTQLGHSFWPKANYPLPPLHPRVLATCLWIQVNDNNDHKCLMKQPLSPTWHEKAEEEEEGSAANELPDGHSRLMSLAIVSIGDLRPVEMNTRAFIYGYPCVGLCIFVSLSLYACIHESTCTCMYAFRNLGLYIFMNVCMCVTVFACKYVF